MTDEFDKMLWVGRFVLTQTDVGGGTGSIKITMRERTVFLYGMIGPDDYAADRNIAAWITDAAGNVVSRTMMNTPADNIRIPFPHDKATALTTNAPNQYWNTIIFAKGEVLVIETSSTLAQNETITVAVKALVPSALPSVAVSGTGTVTLTTTYSKVV